MTNTDNKSTSDNKPGNDEFIDAICRHICHVLGYDYCLIDIVSGHEIINYMSFTVGAKDQDRDSLISSLKNEQKQPLTLAHTLIAQKVKQTKQPWIGKAYAQNGPKEGYPYLIIPITEIQDDGKNLSTKGLLRIVSLNSNYEISEQDISTIQNFCQQLSGRLKQEHLVSDISGDDLSQGKVTIPQLEIKEKNTILVIHSSRHIRRRFTRILSEKYTVFEADSSAKAFNILDNNLVDLVILDAEIPLNLEDDEPNKFYRVLKESPKWKHLPLILVTSEANLEGKIDGLNAGADDCLSEECHEAELSARVLASLRLRKTEQELAFQSRLLEDYAARLEQEFEKVRETSINNIKSKQLLEAKNLELEQSRFREQLLSGQAETLQRISDIIRKSFHINENISQMLELLAERYSLDACFAILPSEDEPQDTIRSEYTKSSEYNLIEHNIDLNIFEIFKQNFNMDQTLAISDIRRDRSIEPFKKDVLIPYHVLSLFYIPITYENKLLGILGGHRCETEAQWTMENKNFFKSVSDQVAIGVTSARLYARVQRQATTDGLTGLFNHRTGHEKLLDQLKLAERYERDISVIMIDVDHFKAINDTYGHPAGDVVLQTIAHLIRISCRDVDIPVRYGGEEFLLILPEVNQEGAKMAADRIRRHIEQEIIKLDKAEISVTASLGIASFPDDAKGSQELLELADKALYMSKRKGRNQIHSASDLFFSEFIAEPKEELSEDRVVADSTKRAEIASLMSQMPSIDPTQDVAITIKDLASKLYAKSEYNKTHHLETARFAELLAKIIGLSKQDIEQVRIASLLHDVGVLSIPDEILNKKNKVSNEEMEVITKHPVLGAELMRPIHALKEICDIVENHHECWDGTGYPHGLKGEEIPLKARIISIVDAYHAMISDRPYRQALTKEKARQILKEGSGSIWDPFLIDIFIALLKTLDEES